MRQYLIRIVHAGVMPDGSAHKEEKTFWALNADEAIRHVLYRYLKASDKEVYVLDVTPE